jgi:Zn finger protein HypA/HybF involved in hydrogenase expression
MCNSRSTFNEVNDFRVSEGMPVIKKEMKKCLKCGVLIKTTQYNRLCYECKDSNAEISACSYLSVVDLFKNYLT